MSKCVQCVWASLTVTKCRSGLAKTNFFLHQPLINETIFSFLFFKSYNQVSMTVSVFQPCIQRWQYAEAGTSELKLIKPLQFSLNVQKFKLPTSPGLRILRVGVSLFLCRPHSISKNNCKT